MEVSEYRQDDQTVGYCPRCGARLNNITVGARGFCPEGHGWVVAEWGAPVICPECETGVMVEDDHVWICAVCGYETSEPEDEEEEENEKGEQDVRGTGGSTGS